MIKNKKGFTLIELLVVIAIIGLLSTLAVVALNNARQKSRDAKRVADVKQMQTALELFYNDCGGYPTGAGALLTNTALALNCPGVTLGTYLATVPTPPTPGDGGAACVAANTYAYQSYDTTGQNTCTAAVGTACPSYAITYCIGATISGIIGDTPRTATPSGM
jgi:prepilin-type N-terminal cleavage/methylation domain-containing protein